MVKSMYYPESPKVSIWSWHRTIYWGRLMVCYSDSHCPKITYCNCLFQSITICLNFVVRPIWYLFVAACSLFRDSWLTSLLSKLQFLSIPSEVFSNTLNLYNETSSQKKNYFSRISVVLFDWLIVKIKVIVFSIVTKLHIGKLPILLKIK